jgi:hypothetical protein
MQPNVYVTEHEISQTVCRHFAEGCSGKLVSPTHLRPGPAVVYGLLRGCGDIVRACDWVGRTFFHVDNGYFRPGHYEGYYRVTENAFQKPPEGVFPSDRWERVGTDLRPWRRDGKFILIVPPSPFVAAWQGIDIPRWVATVHDEIQRYTDRQVRVKPEKGRMDEALRNCWTVVTHNSMAACHALREGVPVITLDPDHVAGPVSWDFPDIDQPWWPEREPWAHGVAYQQWTLDEFASGEAWDVFE